MTIISGHSLIYFQNNTFSANILLTNVKKYGIFILGRLPLQTKMIFLIFL